ncbi:[Fe-Fe] hydrogenase large subunit C-terminal domain-containing protein [Thermodesulfitimonas sp.]
MIPPLVWAALADPQKHVVVQTAPATHVAIGEAFGLPPGTDITGKMVAALRRLGFDAVFDTNFTGGPHDHGRRVRAFKADKRGRRPAATNLLQSGLD